MKKMSILLLVAALVLVSLAPMAAVSAATSVKLQYFSGNRAATTNTLYLNLKLVNTGTDPIALSTVKIRYYFTNDGTQPLNFSIDYSNVGSGNVTGTFGTLTGATNADRYLEIGFTSGAGTLAPGASVEVKIRIWKSDWSNFTQTNDYSFNPSPTNYVDSTYIAVYINGVLVWGTEPGGTATPTATPTPAITPTVTPTVTPTPTPTATPTAAQLTSFGAYNQSYGQVNVVAYFTSAPSYSVYVKIEKDGVQQTTSYLSSAYPPTMLEAFLNMPPSAPAGIYTAVLYSASGEMARKDFDYTKPVPTPTPTIIPTPTP